MSCQGQALDVRLAQGAARTLVIPITDGAATPTGVNVAGWNGTFKIKRNVIGASPIVEFDQDDDDLDIGGTVATEVHVTISGARSALLDPTWHCYDLDLVDDSGVPFTVAKGYIDILPHP